VKSGKCTRESLRLAAIVLVLLTVRSGQGGVEVETLIRNYDDGRTKVLSPSTDVSASFNHDTMKLNAGWAADILTSASADVQTFASKGVNSKIADRRIEYSTSFETQIPDGTISAGYIQSDENDYHSKIYSAGGTREFFTKNTVISFGFANGHDHVQSSGDPTFNKPMENQNYSLSLTQVLSKISIIQFLYDFRVENGWLSSPYRRAKLINTTTGGITGVAEVHPLTRNRNAWAVKYNYFFNNWKTSSASTYRLYQDSWGVLSHTFDQRFTREFGRHWNVSVSARYYTQHQASFYQDYYYDNPGPFHTGNNTLATYQSYLIGFRPAYQATDKLNIFAKAEYFMQNFANATDAHLLSTLDDDKKLKINAVVIGAGIVVKF
jgi:hypothetical protein